MADFGLDLLTNPSVSTHLETIEMPIVFEEAPKLVPSLDTTGPVRTHDGLENLNASAYIPSPPPRMNEEHLMKAKYELLRKFERLQRAGVPMRKRFTIDSPMEEMKTELEALQKEKAADQTIKQFCDWYITAMSGLEWGSQNMTLLKAFGLNLQGLSQSAQMNVGDMEEDFEELYDLYGDKLRIHPLVRIPLRTCMMVYMVHLTNQMALKSNIPNIEEILRTNPDIGRQLASAAMQQQTQEQKSRPPPPPPQTQNPMAGLANFMSSMVPPPPAQETRKPAIKTAIRLPTPARMQQPNVPSIPPRDMAPPSNIDDLLKSVNVQPKRKGGSTGKNSVSIKL